MAKICVEKPSEFCKHTHKHTHAYTHSHTYIHICMHIHMHTHMHMHVHTCVHTYPCIHACIHMCIHTHMNTHMHAVMSRAHTKPLEVRFLAPLDFNLEVPALFVLSDGSQGTTSLFWVFLPPNSCFQAWRELRSFLSWDYSEQKTSLRESSSCALAMGSWRRAFHTREMEGVI